jgi:hypothetical protein
MGNISIVNQQHGARTGVYVGRPTVLGNPYRVEELGREQAVARYRVWLRQQWQLGGAPRAQLLALARQYKAAGQLVLSCWCAPRQCHAEVIRDAVLGIVQKGLV